MKRLFVVLVLFSFIRVSSLGDGYVLFVNRVTGVMDAPITLEGVSNQVPFRAALHLAEQGFQKLYPETNFRDTSEAAGAYLYPVVVPVPGKEPGDTVRLQVVIYPADPALPEWGSYLPFEVRLGTRDNPGIPTSMEGFTVLGEPLWAQCWYFLGPECDIPPNTNTFEVKIHGDHVMLYPWGIEESSLSYQAQYSEDLVNWFPLPSAIRDKIQPGQHRYYRNYRRIQKE